MNLNSLLFLMASVTLILLICLSCAPREETIPLRVMSYNIAAGYGDLNRIAEVIREEDPNVVGLQEVDVHWSDRSGFENQARALGEALDMHYFFGEIYDLPPQEEGMSSRRYGLAWLGKEPFVHMENHTLTRLSTQSEDSEPELLPGFPEVRAQWNGQTVHFFNTHLDYRGDPSVREMQVRDMLSVMNQADVPVIMLGDLNARPGSPELDPLFENLQDSWAGRDDPGYTFPTGKADRRIDYILHSDHFEVTDVYVVTSRASDHLPVVVDLELR